MNQAKVLGGKDYDGDEIRAALAERGIEQVIPRFDRRTAIEYDREAYKHQNLIERCVNRLMLRGRTEKAVRGSTTLVAPNPAPSRGSVRICRSVSGTLPNRMPLTLILTTKLRYL